MRLVLSSSLQAIALVQERKRRDAGGKVENSGSTIDWTLLLPQLGSEFIDSTFTTQDLSASIILFMIAVAIIAMIYVIIRSVATLRGVRFLTSLLGSETPESLSNNRRNLLNNARERPKLGALWNEFDETLVASHDGSQLYNTVDASYFFNTHSLARGVTESRLLSALPGILTALGVFGTFVGLQLGISALDFSQEAGALQTSVKTLIAGAAVAFSTSVWGVGTSMVFNFFEKVMEQLLRRRIYALQVRIDALFPRASAEQTLIQIQHHNAQSEELLKGLGEQIGERMQKAVADVADGVQSGIQQAINPAIEKLVTAAGELSSRQEAGSERALEGLVNKFSDSIGKMGGEQREAFEKTAGEVRASLSAWSTSMGGLTEELDAKLENWAKIEDGRESTFRDQIALLTQYQKSTTDKIDEILRRNTDNAEQILAQGRTVNEQSRATNASIETLSRKLEDAASRMESSTQSLENLSTTIATASSTLAQAQTAAARSIESASKDAISVTQAVSNLTQGLDQLRDTMKQVATELRQSAEVASSTFSKLEETQAAFLESLANRMTELGQRINKLLVDYTERVRGQTELRLNEWNTQTSQFVTTMVDAVTNMQDILNEVEDALSQPQRNRTHS